MDPARYSLEAIAQRLLWVYANESPYALAKKIEGTPFKGKGTSDKSIRKYFNAESFPSREILLYTLIERRISLNWLIFEIEPITVPFEPESPSVSQLAACLKALPIEVVDAAIQDLRSAKPAPPVVNPKV